MPSTKTGTPPAHDNPALALGVGSADEKATLAKLAPAKLPNEVLLASLQQNHPEDSRWRTFRNDFRYIYVLSWMCQCRGYVKLASEHFDVDLFEIELFDLVSPPPVDEAALLLNKLRLALISKVHGKRVSSLAMFDALFRVYFGSDTPLGGPAENTIAEAPTTETTIASTSVEGHQDAAYPSFDSLYIDEKLQILYILISEVSSYPEFRDYLDKAKLTPDQMRVPVIGRPGLGSKTARSATDYLILFDRCALYKRSIVVPELRVPKKRKLAPEYPELHFKEEAFDVLDVSYELVFKDVYGYDAFVRNLLKNKKAKSNKALLDLLKAPSFVSNMFASEIRKRKILASRRKEFEMARLLATRKRSSRIEAKEKQKHVEEQERRARELEDLQHAATRRSQRAHNQLQEKLKMDFTAGLSRGERLVLRKEKAVETDSLSSTAQTPEPQLKAEPLTESVDLVVPDSVSGTEAAAEKYPSSLSPPTASLESVTNSPNKEPHVSSEGTTSNWEETGKHNETAETQKNDRSSLNDPVANEESFNSETTNSTTSNGHFPHQTVQSTEEQQ